MGPPSGAPHKRLTGSHAPRPSSRQGLKVAAAVIVPLLVAAALIGLVASFHTGDKGSSSSSSSTTTTTASKAALDFQTKVDEAFRPLSDAIKVFLPQAQEFDGGKVAPADFKPLIDQALPEFVKARDAVAALPPYKKKPIINRYFVDAADLYVETARIYSVAVDPASEPLRAQLNIAAKRVRTLGDRIYDRGRVVIDPGFYAPTTKDVESRPPTEVPDWVAEGMAAGPPLAAEPGPPLTWPFSYRKPIVSAVSAARQTVDRMGPAPYGPRLTKGLTAGPAQRGFCLEARATMKIVNSLKSAKKRDKNCRIVRRKGRIYVINKKNPRMKARQG